MSKCQWQCCSVCVCFCTYVSIACGWCGTSTAVFYLFFIFLKKGKRSLACLETLRYPPIWAALAPPCCWDLAGEWLSLHFPAKPGHLMNISNLSACTCSADVWGKNTILAEPARAAPHSPHPWRARPLQRWRGHGQEGSCSVIAAVFPGWE